MLLVIDPGSVESSFVEMTTGFMPIDFAKDQNDIILRGIEDSESDTLIICRNEGKDISERIEAAEWGGRFVEAAVRRGMTVEKVRMRGENISGLRMEYINRFATKDRKQGRGSKASPDWFYGFSKVEWKTYIAGAIYLDLQRKEKEGMF